MRFIKRVILWPLNFIGMFVSNGKQSPLLNDGECYADEPATIKKRHQTIKHRKLEELHSELVGGDIYDTENLINDGARMLELKNKLRFNDEEISSALSTHLAYLRRQQENERNDQTKFFRRRVLLLVSVGVATLIVGQVWPQSKIIHSNRRSRWSR